MSIKNAYNYVKNNNDVVALGANFNGQLGRGNNKCNNYPVTIMQNIPIRQIACGSDHTVILGEDHN